MRIGHGYDVHRLVENRSLIMGGVHIPFELGLLGHSDADVVLHAAMDAILGALALGDIGKHFSDQDARFKDIDSQLLMKEVYRMMDDEQYFIGNMDITIVAQKPKIAPHIQSMRENIARLLHCKLSQINVKATTEEGLGFTGHMEGISCHTVCLLLKK